MGICDNDEIVKIHNPRRTRQGHVRCSIRWDPSIKGSGWGSQTGVMVTLGEGSTEVGNVSLRYNTDGYRKKKHAAHIIVDYLFVRIPWRRLGVARHLMSSLLKVCHKDYPRCDVYLIACPPTHYYYDPVTSVGKEGHTPSGCTTRQLVLFYKSLGFERYDQKDPKGRDAADPYLVKRWK